jgi:hypothetical protein
MKLCNKCGVYKELEFFYNDKEKRDGKSTLCKMCRDSYSTVYRKTEKGKASRKIEYEKYKNSGKKNIASTKWKRKNKHKVKANHDVEHTINRGEIIRPSFCSICFTDCKPEAHHEDYSKTLDVVWACKECHEMIHMTIGRNN